jgi:DNA-binding MarR family transcriptional regulator
VNPEDGRGVLAAITPRGRDRALEATNALNGSLFKAVDLSPSDTETLFRLLGKLRKRAGDFD